MKITLLLFGTVWLVGCGSLDSPRLRIGSLPFPGPLTFHQYVDADDLGPHRYSLMDNIFGEGLEQSRGILYTEKAGFLDLAHIRFGMDWTAYVSRRVRDAMEKNQRGVTIRSLENTRYFLTFHYPPNWASMSEPERGATIDEVSIRIGQRVAYKMTLWHEMVTWYDYGLTLVVSEKGSSFTYEDNVSNMLGVLVAGRALRDSSRDYDAAATDYLNEAMDELGVVSIESAALRTEAVEGRWWANGRAIRRFTDHGLDGEPLRGWLVTEDGQVLDPSLATPLYLPGMVLEDGRDFSSIYHLKVDATHFIASEVRGLFPDRPRRLQPKRDFPVAIRHIESDMVTELGDEVHRPHEPPSDHDTRLTRTDR